MRRAVFKSADDWSPPAEDVLRVMDAVAGVMGLHVSSDTAARAWEAYSEDRYATSWAGPYRKPEKIASAVERYLMVIDE